MQLYRIAYTMFSQNPNKITDLEDLKYDAEERTAIFMAETREHADITAVKIIYDNYYFDYVVDEGVDDPIDECVVINEYAMLQKDHCIIDGQDCINGLNNPSVDISVDKLHIKG